ncbi:NAD(P)/FAD-dependent oxidoreductase [Sphingomonas mollis]|uniref:FAD-dependent monooxygenase n=1 Tax=Sphingomonas mollis TaxID=2795726 RepID=A0ABS0XQT9_9SPHN|nr:FAD-dependent monooxygenase [Sphingomonas sp. BT553]MBJ6122401.1 FAD-dependent monooxygenase [Sphingomonas sp. BT553]
MRRTPALILGGGPAGTAAAIALAQFGGERPLLLERSRETGNALCGGFLSWRSLDTLATLGIAADDLNRARITRTRLFAGSAMAEAPLPRPALAVSRHRLDTLLMARAATVAAVERGVAVRAIEDDTIRLADGGTLTTDALFLATGKHDLRGLARPEDARGADPTLGLRVRLTPHPALGALVGDAIELHLFDRGYAGLAVQEDGSANLCLAVRRSRLTEAGSPAALLTALADRSPALADRLAYMAPGEPIDAIANVPYGWRQRDGVAGLFRLGDQAGVIPSLAGEGMGIALASGIAAARAHAGGGPAAAARWQTRFARTLARPIGVADWLRTLAEGRAAPWMVRASHPALIRLIAHATRLKTGVIPTT